MKVQSPEFIPTDPESEIYARLTSLKNNMESKLENMKSNDYKVRVK